MRINDEQIISALLNCGSLRKAAESLGTTANTISNRLKKDDFRKRYETAKAELLSETVGVMKSNLSGAVNTLTEVMNNKENPATVRVSAADSLLRHTTRYIEVAEIESRISKLESDRGADNEEL